MLFLIWLLYASFGLTAGSIAPLVEPIIKDLNMSYSEMGLILGAWQFVYIFTASPLGAIVDRLGVRHSLGLGIIVVLISLILRGLAQDFYTLLFAVALFGVGGPIISIGAPKIVSLWFQGNERNIAAGIYTTGPLTGTAVALATAGGVVVPLIGSWRGISIVYGSVILIVAIAWWVFSKESPLTNSTEYNQRDDNTSTLTVISELLRIRNVKVVLVMAFATFLLNHGLGNWLPTLLTDGGMTITEAGTWAALGTAIGISGLLIIPPIARQGYRALTMAVLLVIAAVAGVGLVFTTGPILILFVIISSMVRGPMMPIQTLILMETPKIGAKRIGAAAGLFFAAAEIGGFSGPFLLGFIRELTGSLNTGIMMLSTISAVLVLIMPLLKEMKPQQVDQLKMKIKM
jgi:cyanate permease